ncbi:MULTISPECIES: hypothetical protein [Microbacterium]|jgi:hypothetical protein|uniref:Uncharacterized protein n=1 Tax=Microbacterium paludicola TaxID=300019 RepID=A0ABU1I143_9MICO|nr:MULTISPECIES: hypothetical protein [Microbacterium]MDF2917308.1 hypothetical protein [Microbacterium sp.]MDR6167605.1 hypothetical protein [Microbacterium paludicola]GAD34878.1 cyclin [Microbacterium sp. TS-1]
MCSLPVTPTEERFTIEGQVVTSFSGVVSRLAAAHPSLAVVDIERVVLREWEAFSASRPVVVPIGVEEGAAEMLAVETSAQIDG